MKQTYRVRLMFPDVPTSREYTTVADSSDWKREIESELHDAYGETIPFYQISILD